MNNFNRTLVKNLAGDLFYLDFESPKITSSEFSDGLREVKSFAVKAYLQIETLAAKDLDELKILKKLESIFDFDASIYSPEVLATYGKNKFFFFTLRLKDSLQPVAFMQIMQDEKSQSDEVKITVMAVDPQMQKRGMAKILLENLELKMPWVKKIFLHTRISNHRAIKVYRDFGFEEDLNLKSLDPKYRLPLDEWVFMTKLIYP